MHAFPPLAMKSDPDARSMRHRPVLVSLAILLLAVNGIPPSSAQTANAIPGAQGFILQNGGDGAGFDGHDYRGKLFSNVMPGTIVETCAYFGGAETVFIAIKTGPNAGPVRHQLAITSTGFGWHCDYNLRAWGFNSLFIYKYAGGSVGGANQCPGDGYWSDDGNTWFVDGCARRAYRLKIVPSVMGLPAPTNQNLPVQPPSGLPLPNPASIPSAVVLQNGGVGAERTYEDYVSWHGQGKYFPTVVPGLITHVCAFFEAGATDLHLAFRNTIYGAPAASASAAITAEAPGWNCAGTAIPWSHTSILVHRIGGSGRISYTSGCPADGYYHYSWWSTDYWYSECATRAYMLIMAPAPSTAEVGTDTTVHAGGLAALRVTASAQVSARAAADYAGEMDVWLKAYAARWQDAIEAAQGGNLARPLNDALDAPNLSPPTPVIVGSGQEEGLVRLQSNPDPNAPKTPHCYGFETHDGPFTEPVQGCWPFAP